MGFARIPFRLRNSGESHYGKLDRTVVSTVCNNSLANSWDSGSTLRLNAWEFLLTQNPYSPPDTDGSVENLARQTPSRTQCPVCDSKIYWARKLRPMFRCSQCNTKLCIRPDKRFAISLLLVCLCVFYAGWRYIQTDPTRILELGYWMTLPNAIALVGMFLISPALGYPTPLNGWRVASADEIAARRSQWNQDATRM